jgi:hypothetical protein
MAAMYTIAQRPHMQHGELQMDRQNVSSMMVNTIIYLLAGRKTIQAPSHAAFPDLEGAVAFRCIIPISVDLR